MGRRGQAKNRMRKFKLKKTDISRVLRGLFLLEIKGEISKKDYTRLYNKFFIELKGGLK